MNNAIRGTKNFCDLFKSFLSSEWEMLKLVYEKRIQLLVYYSWQRPYDTHIKYIVVINTNHGCTYRLIICVCTTTFIINKLIE